MASSSSDPTLPVILFILALLAVSSDCARDAPAPSVDCSSIVLTMADCLSFVSNGSTVNKPEGNCCSGLKTVLKTDAACLCEAFRSSAQLGVVLNVTKAVTLPAACKVSAPSATNCGFTIVPASAIFLSFSFFMLNLIRFKLGKLVPPSRHPIFLFHLNFETKICFAFSLRNTHLLEPTVTFECFPSASKGNRGVANS